MSALREAGQQALEALLTFPHDISDEMFAAIAALKAALAQQAEPVQEPVAVVGFQDDVWRFYNGQWAPPGEPIKTAHMLKDLPVGTMLYTAPPQRKPLTEEEIHDRFHAARNAKLGASLDNSRHRLSVVEIARAIERAHGIIESEIKEDKA